MDLTRLRGAGGRPPPVGNRRRSLQLDRLRILFLDKPALAAVRRFVQLVAAAFAARPAVDRQAAARLGGEIKLLDGAVVDLAEKRALAPGLAAIRRQKKKWILRQGR